MVRPELGRGEPGLSIAQTKEIADAIRRALPHVKSGSLRVWGCRFGRPHDNCHAPVWCEAEDDCLRVRFNEGEILSVWSPRGAVVDAETFRIDEALRVRWEWFHYGRPKTPENLCFEDFTRNRDKIAVSTNIDWHKPEFHPDASYPAVEIV